VSIPEILERRARLPQSSVYRNLAVLESAGAVRRVLGVDEFTRYELAEDLTEHHHHLVCRRCGSVSDFPSSTRFERTLARAVEEVAGATGFVPDSHRLDLVGTCASCAAAEMGVAGSARKNVGHG
jgi:Fe2+ or Zn2+ uptake regulation protein